MPKGSQHLHWYKEDSKTESLYPDAQSSGQYNTTMSKAMGFTFDNAPVKTEYAACSAVQTQYRVALECGAMDPDQALKEFNDALYAAGLQKIMDEKQKQLDEWAASK